MADKISADKAEFNKRIHTNQEQAQALLEIEKEEIENCLQGEQSDSMIRCWYQQSPEMIFNPFQEEEPSEVIKYPCSCIIQERTLHGKQLINYLLDALMQKNHMPISDNFTNMGNGNKFLGLSNNILLSMQVHRKGYQNHNWCSNGYIMKNGLKVKENEQPCYLCYWTFEKNEQPISLSDVFCCINHKEEAAETIICKGSCYAVYNVEQIIGISSEKEDIPFSMISNEILERFERVVSGMGVKVLHDKQPFYNMSDDCISIPTLPVEQYCIEMIYQACLATAYKERLNRSLEKWQEKLCCMIAGAVLCSHFQLKGQSIVFAETIQELYKLLNANRYAVFSIIKEATRVIEYLLELFPDTYRNLTDYEISQPLQSRVEKAKKRQKGGAL